MPVTEETKIPSHHAAGTIAISYSHDMFPSRTGLIRPGLLLPSMVGLCLFLILCLALPSLAQTPKPSAVQGTQKPELVVDTGASGVNSVAYSPDGKILASGGLDGTIKVWDVASGQLLKTLTGHLRWLESVCFSPDGKALVGGSADSIVLWDVTTGQLIKTLKWHALSSSSG